MSRACYYQLRNIGRIRPLITEDDCKTLVCSLVTSRLDYANALLFGINTTEIAKLQRIQNSAVRIITCTRKREHITPILVTLHWLPIDKRIQYKILLYTYKVVNHIAPEYIAELFTLHHPGLSLRSANKRSLKRPLCRTSSYGYRRFDVAAASL